VARADALRPQHTEPQRYSSSNTTNSQDRESKKVKSGAFWIKVGRGAIFRLGNFDTDFYGQSETSHTTV
jgi:hypothetical protein